MRQVVGRPVGLVAPGAGAVAAQAAAGAGERPLLQLLAAVLLVGQAEVVLRRHRGLERREPQRALVVAARLLALGLAADAVLVLADAGLPAVGFVVGSSLASLLAFRGVLLWDRLGSGVPDYGDWSNALGMLTVLVGTGVLVVHGLDAPAAAWPAWQELVWLGQVATGVVLMWSITTVGRLSGLARDLRLWIVLVAYGLAVVAQCGASSLGFDVTQQTTALGYVLVCTAALVALDRELPARRPGSERPPVTTTHSLIVLGAASALLLVAALTGTPGASATTAAAAVAGVGVVLGFTRLLGVVRELEQASRSRQEARTDELTGVANRRGLEAALVDASRGSRPQRRPVALLFVDVRGFRDLNDRFGPDAADEVLRALARRMSGTLHGRQLLARLSGDQFAVLLPGAGPDGALAAIDPLLAAFAEPLAVRGASVRLTARVGFAVRDAATALSTDELMRRAHVALYSAKRTDAAVATYDRAEDELARDADRRLDELRRLLSGDPDQRCGQLVVHYQPQLEIATGRLVGAEALVRWQHPDLGLLAPAAFVGLAEDHGLMRDLTRRVLGVAARESARWERAGRPLRVSVNLSSSLFADGDVVCLVDEALRESGASASLVVLEITESVLLQNAEAVPGVLEDLATRRVSLSVDDFGTGYSSLAYLADLPVDELKIDRSFVRRLVQDRRTHAVVAGTIDLARRLDLRVVAEGVEDEATLTVLRDLGCDVSQGYLHARPLDAETLRSWYEERERVLD